MLVEQAIDQLWFLAVHRQYNWTNCHLQTCKHWISNVSLPNWRERERSHWIPLFIYFNVINKCNGSSILLMLMAFFLILNFFFPLFLLQSADYFSAYYLKALVGTSVVISGALVSYACLWPTRNHRSEHAAIKGLDQCRRNVRAQFDFLSTRSFSRCHSCSPKIRHDWWERK